MLIKAVYVVCVPEYTKSIFSVPFGDLLYRDDAECISDNCI